MNGSIELLAPARDGPTARAAILCGADAVYLGAPRFGAREAAGNPLTTIREVTAFAHQYYARVYVALNTLLHDDELPVAERIIRELYTVGIDALIIQDVGLLELDLPPLPLIASTQMHNATAEKVKFWEDIGFSRVILARELTLEQIRQIRRRTRVELECFVHGALCVGASGQCYLSYALGGRSGNRGQCAQPCRRLYTLKDQRDRTIVKDRHLLSLKDLNLSEHLEELIDAGITSFKIEGRLKDVSYVTNTVGFYRQKLDAILPSKGLQRNSSGTTQLSFQPNPVKTFNRGFTDYGLTGRLSSVAALDTPKSVGEYVGTIRRVEDSCFLLDAPHDLHNADGICFFDRQRNLDGTLVNRVQGSRVYPQKMHGLHVGQEIYRNFDHEFSRKLAGRAAQRKVRLALLLEESAEGLSLSGTDEDGIQARVAIAGPKQPAQKEEATRRTILTQLTRLGNTIFECSGLQLRTDKVYFLPLSRLNAAKRELVEALLRVREARRPRWLGQVQKNTLPYPQPPLTYLGNVLNEEARAFYRRHGVRSVAPAAECGLDLSGEVVMTTKLCLRKELGLCRHSDPESAEPLSLEDEEGRRLELRFRCGPCGMEIAILRSCRW
jgi:collagenase-like PrtC family protease